MPGNPLQGSRCPACESNLTGEALTRLGHGVYINCRECGRWLLSDDAAREWPERIPGDRERVLVCRWIRARRAAGDEPPKVTTYAFDELLRGELPSASEIREGLVLWVLTKTGGAGQKVQTLSEPLRAELGILNDGQLVELLKRLVGEGLLEWKNASVGFWMKLTHAGQEAAEEIKRSRTPLSSAPGDNLSRVDVYHRRMIREAPWQYVENLSPLLDALTSDGELTSAELSHLATRVPSGVPAGSTTGGRLTHLREAILSLADSKRDQERARRSEELVSKLATAIELSRPQERWRARLWKFVTENVFATLVTTVIGGVLLALALARLGLSPPD